MRTRPVIIYATSKASRKNQNPPYEDWMNILKIFRYLKGTKYYRIKFNKNLSIKVYDIYYISIAKHKLKEEI